MVSNLFHNTWCVLIIVIIIILIEVNSFIHTVHRLIFLNILFNIFSIDNLIMSIANLTRMPNDSSINPMIILHT